MAGNQRDVNAVLKEYRPRIHRYLSHLIGPRYADDVTQEALLKVSQSYESFQGRSQLSTWIYRIASNTALDTMRSRAFKEDRSLIGEDDLIIEDQSGTGDGKVLSIDQQVVEQEMNSCIRGVIDGLPDKYSVVLTLSEFENFKDREITEILQVTLEAVKIRLHRARSRLRRELESVCEFYHTGKNQLACEPTKP